MRVRAVDANGDMVFGAGAATFLIDTPEAVMQCVLTALKLYQGEWFLNTTAGMPWKTQVLGFGTQGLYDNAIKNCILAVPSVTGISEYVSSLNSVTRQLAVSATIQTQFGDAALATSLAYAAAPTSGFGVGPYGANLYGA